MTLTHVLKGIGFPRSGLDMPGINSLLFLLTTLAPYTEPPEIHTVPYDVSYEEHGRLKPIQDKDLPACETGEKYSWCGANPVCQRNCSTYFTPTACPQVCVPGCVCKYGKVRGTDGKCMNADECPEVPAGTNDYAEYDYVSSNDLIVPEHIPFLPIPSCEYGEEFSWCKALPLCQKTCSNYENSPPCPQLCFPGCVCKYPTIRGPEYNCIRPNECPNLPDENKWSTTNEGMSVKEISSVTEDFQDEERIEWHTSKEVMPVKETGSATEDFKNQERQYFNCKENEYLSVVGTNYCPDNCDNFKDRKRPCKRIPFLVPTCVCKVSYVRGPAGNCIKPQDCPSNERIPIDFLIET